MSKAKTACLFVQALSQAKFPDDALGMEKHTVEWLLSLVDIKDSGSHKYIPTEKLNNDLGLEQGAGVFGYVQFQDGSYLLQTCRNGVAYWDGGESKPEFLPREKAQ